MLLIGLYVAIVDIIVLLVVAFYTLVERKVIASIQRRRGPNVIEFVTWNSIVNYMNQLFSTIVFARFGFIFGVVT